MAHPVELREGLARLSAEQLQRIFEAYYRNAKRWETFPDTREKQVDEACRDVFGLGVEAALAKAPGQLRLLVHRVLDPTTKAKTISAPDLADVIIEEAGNDFEGYLQRTFSQKYLAKLAELGLDLEVPATEGKRHLIRRMNYTIGRVGIVKWFSSPAFIQPDIARLLQVFGIDAAQLKSRPDMAAALAAKIYLPLRDIPDIGDVEISSPTPLLETPARARPTPTKDTQKRKREEGDVPDLVSDESEEVEESEGDEDGEEDEEDEESESPRKRGANRKPVARPSKRARVEKEEKPERKGRASKDASDPSTLPVTKMDLGPIPEDPTAPISWNVFFEDGTERSMKTSELMRASPVVVSAIEAKMRHLVRVMRPPPGKR